MVEFDDSDIMRGFAITAVCMDELDADVDDVYDRTRFLMRLCGYLGDRIEVLEARVKELESVNEMGLQGRG